MWKTIKSWTISAIIVALSLACAYLYYFGRREAVVRRIVDAPLMLKEIQQLSELVTVKYSIQKVIGLEEEKVPFGSEKILLLVQANVLGGVDLTQIKPEHCVVEADNSVALTLPPPKVLQVFINEKETRVWDRSKTWWTPWVSFNPEIDRKARLAALEAAQVGAVEMGILSNAQENAQQTIREFLHAMGVESVRFNPVRSEKPTRNKLLVARKEIVYCWLRAELVSSVLVDTNLNF